MVRNGIGFDVHPFAPDRKLILGGVEIAYEKGLLGHSDADVVCHAIADALLGAAGLGDIGMMFPDTDPRYSGFSSLLLLQKVAERLQKEGFQIGNVDITIIAQEPKIGAYSEMMRTNISSMIGLGEEMVNIKGKTTEALGFIGRKEGIAALAIATLSKDEF